MSPTTFDIDYVPEFTICTRNDTDVIRLPSTLRKQDGVMENHFKEGFACLRSLVFLALFTTVIGCGRSLGKRCTNNGRNELPEKRVTYKWEGRRSVMCKEYWGGEDVVMGKRGP